MSVVVNILFLSRFLEKVVLRFCHIYLVTLFMFIMRPMNVTIVVHFRRLSMRNIDFFIYNVIYFNSTKEIITICNKNACIKW